MKYEWRAILKKRIQAPDMDVCFLPGTRVYMHFHKGECELAHAKILIGHQVFYTFVHMDEVSYFNPTKRERRQGR